MQKLYSINIVKLAKRLEELKEVIRIVYKARIVINDVLISNVILNARDKIILINFGFTRRIRENVPTFFPS